MKPKLPKPRSERTFGWPITQERYRQVLAKMHRYYWKIEDLSRKLKMSESQALKEARAEVAALKSDLGNITCAYEQLKEVMEGLNR